MRVLQFLKTSDGAAWALRQMADLVSLGVKVHVALPAGGRHVTSYRAAGVVTHEFDAPRGSQLIALRAHAATIRRLVEQINPDVVHSHFVATAVAARVALRRSVIPRIFQVPGPLHLEHLPFRFAEIATAARNDYWIATCDWTYRRYLASGVPAERVFKAFYGLETTRFNTVRTNRLRDQLGIGRDEPLLGMVAFTYAPKRYLGHRRGIKGHEDFIDAVALLRRQHPKVRGVVIGAGAWNGLTPYDLRLREYARERCGDAILFAGMRQDVAAIYADLDVAVHPSHSENLGGAGESLLCSVPTIATDVGGFPDIVIPGRTGWLVPAKSPVPLASAMADALRDRATARQLAQNGRDHMLRLVDPIACARRVADIYGSVATRALAPRQCNLVSGVDSTS